MGSITCNSVNSDVQYKRRLSRRCSNITIEKLNGLNLDITIEISSNIDLNEKKKSIDWFINELKFFKCSVNVNYKVLHNKRNEFLLYVHKDNIKKIILSNASCHLDAINGQLINRKNLNSILENILAFLDINNISMVTIA